MRKIEIKNQTYTLNEIKENYETKKFRIPKYQRRYVWDSKKRGKLIDSLIKGYPIGNIIIWKNNDFEYVLDGQQRTRSLLLIRKFPFKDLEIETFSSLFKNENLNVSDDVFANIFLNLRNVGINDLYSDAYDENNYIKNYINNLSKISHVNDVIKKEIIRILNTYISRLYKGSDIKVPSINILNSSEEDAVEIFDRLNSEGIKLTKMERLSANWSTNNITINNEELKETIKNIYKLDNSEDIRELQNNTPSEIIWTILVKSLKDTYFFKKLFTYTEEGVISLNTQHIDKLLWLIRVMIIQYNNENLEEKLSSNYDDDLKIGEELSKIINTNEEWILKAIDTLSKTWNILEREIPILSMVTNKNFIFINAAPTNLFVSLASQIFFNLLKDENFVVPKTLQLMFIKEILNGSYESSTNVVVKDSIATMEYLGEISPSVVSKKLEEINNLQKEEINSKKGFNNISKLVISMTLSKYSKDKLDKYDFNYILPIPFLKKNDLSRGKNSIGNCGLFNSSVKTSTREEFKTNEILQDKIVDINGFDKKEYKELLNKFNENNSRENFNSILDFRFKFISKVFIDNISPLTF